MMTQKMIRIALGILIAGLVLHSGNAIAGVTYYSGNSCKAAFPSQENQLAYYGWAIYNSSTPIYVTCPVRTTDTNTNSANWHNVYVHVPAGTTMTCYYDENEQDGTLIEREVSSVSGPYTGWIGGAHVTDISYGFATNWCLLPTGAYITTYYHGDF